MNIFSIIKKILILLIIVLIVGLTVRVIFQPSEESIIFEVTIPAHTPDLDAIILHMGNNQYVMTRESDSLYKYELKYVDFPDQEEGTTIHYGYSRGGFTPFGEVGLYNLDYIRTFKIKPGSTVRDTVDEWKWFPIKPLNETLIATQVDTYPVAQRNEFWKGVMFVDFWNDEWEYQYDSSIAHLQNKGYEWIALAPPWDFVTEDPPVISDTDVEVPSYPEDKLRNHIRVFKDAGFNVLLTPQICCTQIDVGNKNEQWWNDWYIQQDKFYQFYVDLVMEEHVDALSIGPNFFGADLPLNPDLPSFINGTERWISAIDLLKSSGVPVGFELSTFSALWPDDDAVPWPGTTINFFDKLDFIGISLWSELVDFDEPTQDDFNYAMERIFQQIDRIHNQTDLPIVFTQISYTSITGTGLGPNPETPILYEDPAIAPYTYNSREQAMVYEALMRGIANRSYVMGTFPFGYWYIDVPLSIGDPSIRGKMAENIYSNWLSRLPNTQTMKSLTSSQFHLKNEVSMDKELEWRNINIWCNYKSFHK